MSTYDVRSNNEEVIDEIVFAEGCDEHESWQAYSITCNSIRKYIAVSDPGESVIINSKEHALNLIKALNKAIELGWIE